MESWQRRAAKTMGGILVLIVIVSIAYHYIMVAIEGRAINYFHSTQIVVETFTGTGFGSDSPWQSPVANGFIIALDLSTFLVLFVVLPYVFQPVLENSLSQTPPRSSSLSDHVIIASEYTPHTERLLREFEARGVEYTVILNDEQVTLDLSEEGKSVVHGDPTTANAFDRAGVKTATAVVIDVEDKHTASSILAVREHNEDVQTIAQCQDPALEAALKYAGADIVVTPRHLLAERIADWVRSELDPRFSDIVNFGEGFAVVEVTVTEESSLNGTTLGESDLAGRNNVRTIGVWVDGEFVVSPSPDTKITENTTIILAGPETELRGIEAQTTSVDLTDATVVIAGAGRIGSTVQERLEEAGINCTTIDLDENQNGDIVGDVTDETTLKEAGIENASVFIAALEDDDEIVLSVVLARKLGKGLDIVARVNDSNSKSKVRRAGANYVLSLPDITSRLIGLNVLRDAVLAYERQMEIVKFGADSLSGNRLADAPIQESDCFVIAVEREGEFLMDVSPQTSFEPDDNIILAGDDEAIESFRSAIA